MTRWHSLDLALLSRLPWGAFHGLIAEIQHLESSRARARNLAEWAVLLGGFLLCLLLWRFLPSITLVGVYPSGWAAREISLRFLERRYKRKADAVCKRYREKL